MRLLKNISLVLCVVVCLAASALASVKANALFSDGCVLQQGMPVPVWGWADNGEKVTVEFQGQTVSATANNGKWMVTLKELKAGGPFEMKLIGSNTITLKNILVGEVWLCSGQSNMEWRMSQTANAKEDIAAANYAKVRLFTVPRNATDRPRYSLACAHHPIPRRATRNRRQMGHRGGQAQAPAQGQPGTAVSHAASRSRTMRNSIFLS